MPKIKIAMLITTLSPGGAERYLLRTLQHLDQSKFDVMVLAIGPMGEIGVQIQKLGMTVVTANVSSNVGFMFKWSWALWQLMKFRPDVLHAWMYHAMAWSVPMSWALRSKIIWSIRNAKLTQGSLPTSTLILAKLLAKHSSKVSTIIYNSSVAQKEHERVGYAQEKSILIHNGFDLPEAQLNSNNEQRDLTLKRHSLNSKLRYVGFVSRYHPQKDIETFLRVVRSIKQQNIPVKFITCGLGLGPQDGDFLAALKKHDIEDSVIPLGVVERIADWYPCFDLSLLTSKEESFPNVIGEAMAWGIPCVSTRVGDVDRLLPPEQLCSVGDATELGNTIVKLLGLSTAKKNGLSTRQKHRLRDYFDIKVQQSLLEDVYLSAIK